MDSQFVNYDGRSVHDMINLLLAASGDPEAIRRLQESINAVDQRAQSSISIVNAAVEQLDAEVDVVANAGAKNILDVSRASLATLVVDSVAEDGAITFKSTSVVGNNQCIGKATLKANVTYRILSDIVPVYGRVAAGSSATSMPTASGSFAPDITMISGGQSHIYMLQYRNSIKESVFKSNSDQEVYFWFAPDEGTPEEFTMRIMVCENIITDNTYVPYGKTNAELSEDTGWLPITGYSNVKYRKKNDVVFLALNGFITAEDIPANTGAVIVTLPEGCRPQEVFRTSIATRGGNNTDTVNRLLINTDGTCTLYAPNESALAARRFVEGIISYPV